MFHVRCIPALEDNYIFLLTCTKTGFTAVVDPGDATPVIEALGDKKLGAILITHHHADHIGGVNELVSKYSCTVYGAKKDAHRLPPLDVALEDNDVLTLANSAVEVIETDGHTVGHISYYFPQEGALFCGDTLFSGGCGRLFEGTAKQLFNSMAKYKEKPSKTKIYCAHEYTELNLTFLLNKFPEDENIRLRLKEAKALRAQNKPTVPSTLAEELKFNRFLTSTSPEELAQLRHKKDIS